MLSRTPTARAARGAAAGLALLALAAPAHARPLLADAPSTGVAVSHVAPADVPDPPVGPRARPIHVSPAEADNAVGASRPVSAPSVVVVHGTGFDWTDAGVGAAASGGIILLLGAGLIVSTRRRGQATQIAH